MARLRMAVAFYPWMEMVRWIGLERSGVMVRGFLLIFTIYLACYFIIDCRRCRTDDRLSSRAEREHVLGKMN